MHRYILHINFHGKTILLNLKKKKNFYLKQEQWEQEASSKQETWVGTVEEKGQ